MTKKKKRERRKAGRQAAGGQSTSHSERTHIKQGEKLTPKSASELHICIHTHIMKRIKMKKEHVQTR